MDQYAVNTKIQTINVNVVTNLITYWFGKCIVPQNCCKSIALLVAMYCNNCRQWQSLQK